jgi:1-acyl-sn-glycerol-3-phosphate acyltransferase
MPHQVEALTRFNREDLIASFGCEGLRWLAPLLHILFDAPARTFARQMSAFDAAVGAHGELGEAARWMLERHYLRGLNIDGRAQVPSEGPALFLANHPGLADAISLIAAINRPDLKILALRRPFLEALRNTAGHLFFIDNNLGKRVILAHDVAAYLRSGGAVLSFPAGKIEPDPEVWKDALPSLNGWVDSARFLAKLAPQTRIVPVLVRGVVWEKAAHHWLTRTRRTRTERDKLAAALQLLAMVVRGAKPTTVNVRFAAPILGAGELSESGVLHQAVIGRMRQLIAEAANGGDEPGRPAPLWDKLPQPT